MNKLTLSQQDTTALSVTVYQDFGAVKEKRKLSLNSEIDTIHYMDVAPRMEVDSLLIQGIRIRDSNLDYDLATKSSLLEKYIGNTVYLKQDSGAPIACRLLSVQGGIVLENEASKEIYLDPKQELILPRLPEGLIVRPALIWGIPPQEAEQVEVSYLTSGLRWHANYVLELQESRCHMTAWVSLTNETGTTYEQAMLKLIAGEVQRLGDVVLLPTRIEEHDKMVVYSAQDGSFEEKSFADYHMYTIDRPVTLKNNQTKQIQLFAAEDIECRKYYACKTYSTTAKICLDLPNTKESGMGVPLPEGRIKVYQRDQADEQLEFIGEDEIEHTPRGETVTLGLGEAFDLVVEHELTEKKKRGHLLLEKHRVEIRSHKEERATIRLTHPVHTRSTYEVTETSHPVEHAGHYALDWTLELAPEETLVLMFTLQIDDSISVKVT